MKRLFSCLILFLLFSCKQDRSVLGIEGAKRALHEALNDKNEKVIFTGYTIRDKKAAIEVAEPILFKTYGKENIIHQKPYEIYLLNGYWVLTGTLPKDMMGGTFLIILSEKDGRVIRLIHGK